MKKVFYLVESCLCIAMTAFFIGCSSDAGGTSLTTVTSAYTPLAVKAAADVTLPATVSYDSTVSASNAESVRTLLSSSNLDTVVKEVAGIQTALSKVSVATNASVSRSATYTEFKSMMQELNAQYDAFATQAEEYGNAGFLYVKTPGEITGLPEGCEMNVEMIRANVSSACSDTIMTTLNECYFVYTSKQVISDSSTPVKSISISANNYRKQSSYSTLDTDQLDSEETNMVTTENIAFVVEKDGTKTAGILKIELSLKGGFTNVDTWNTDSSELAKYYTCTGTYKIYDLEGNFICDYKTITNPIEVMNILLSSVNIGSN